MKVKTSVTLSEELLHAISAQSDHHSRSAFIEEATWRYLRSHRRRERDRVDFELINRDADRLNAEALDALTYQDYS